jgi:tRNA pseudouridine13 synthase
MVPLILGGRFLRRLALSSVQSALFNRYLAARLDDGFLQRVLPGEVLQVCASGGPFVTDDVAREQARFAAREVVPAGPMFGPKMKATQDEAELREARLLEAAGVTLAQFAAQGKLTLGTRRANVVWPQELQAEAQDGDVRLTFTLPAGSYATCVLRELMKGEPSAAG